MDDRIVTAYVLINDLLQSLNHSEDVQRQMSDADVLNPAPRWSSS